MADLVAIQKHYENIIQAFNDNVILHFPDSIFFDDDFRLDYLLQLPPPSEYDGTSSDLLQIPVKVKPPGRAKLQSRKESPQAKEKDEKEAAKQKIVDFINGTKRGFKLLKSTNFIQFGDDSPQSHLAYSADGSAPFSLTKHWRDPQNFLQISTWLNKSIAEGLVVQYEPKSKPGFIRNRKLGSSHSYTANYEDSSKATKFETLQSQLKLSEDDVAYFKSQIEKYEASTVKKTAKVFFYAAILYFLRKVKLKVNPVYPLLLYNKKVYPVFLPPFFKKREPPSPQPKAPEATDQSPSGGEESPTPETTGDEELSATTQQSSDKPCHLLLP